jgi:nucleotide-binding universal stress UspA family protein
MSQTTVMVHLEIGSANTGVLRAAASLAAALPAEVIGIAACQPVQVLYSEGYVSADVMQQGSDELDRELKVASAEFHTAFPTGAWRGAVTMEPLADFLARQSRAADLVITSIDQNVSVFDTTRHVNLADLVTQTGRPVLVVPTALETLAFTNMMICWQDTSECRRAVADALPLLALAQHVSLVEIADAADLPTTRQRLDDVAAWLARHNITAQAEAIEATESVATLLNIAADTRHADIIVAGAFGHSRLREWLFGGVTDDLLLQAGRSALVSH